MARIEPPPPLGVALRHLREQAGWTQAEFEDRAGLSRKSISKLERGTHQLDRPLLTRLAEVLDFDAGWVDATVAAVEQLPCVIAPGGAPTDLTPNEHATLQSVTSVFVRGLAADLEAAFGAALIAVRWQNERDAAGTAWRTLCRLPTFADRRTLVQDAREFQTWAVCERLCEESVRATTHDLDQARQLAELSVIAAERSEGSEEWRSYLVAYCYAFVGYSWLIKGDYREAARGFEPFVKEWRIGRGGAGPLDETAPMLGYCLLLRLQQQYRDALAITEDLLRRSLGPLQVARLLINKASILEKLDDFKGALGALSEARPYAAEAKGERLLWAIDYNEAAYLCDCDRIAEAQARIPSVRAAALAAGRDLDLLRLRWLDARIAEKAGRWDEAAQGLRLVFREFVDRGVIFDAAQAALELAALELTRGRSREVKSLAGGSASLFAGLGLPARLLASIDLFWQGALREAATSETARRLVLDLRNLRLRNLAS